MLGVTTNIRRHDYSFFFSFICGSQLTNHCETESELYTVHNTLHITISITSYSCRACHTAAAARKIQAYPCRPESTCSSSSFPHCHLRVLTIQGMLQTQHPPKMQSSCPFRNTSPRGAPWCFTTPESPGSPLVVCC